jgi:hypothetical protein
MPVEITIAEGEKLSKGERKDLAKLRNTIHTGFSDIVTRGIEVGKALLEIRDRRLYREKKSNFETFCSEVLSIARSRAYELLNAAEVRQQLSAMADTIVQPANERQIRPLVSLKTAEKRQAAWVRALAIAGSAKVSEKHVRKAIKEGIKSKVVIAPLTQTWMAELTKRLMGVGFVRAFEQPIKWPGDAAQLFLESSRRYLRLIDVLTLEEVACAKALQQAAQGSLVVVNADANAPEGLLLSTDGDIIQSFGPAFDLVAKEIGLFVEDDGVFYEAGALDAKYQAVWSPLGEEQLVTLGLIAIVPPVQPPSDVEESMEEAEPPLDSEGEDLPETLDELASKIEAKTEATSC